ncbi:MAG: hypothetical protein DWP92_01340 [Armatimonadetes bacterium]|nr:MAG: hypothetical protein DWP92_01340 [Armatimonadota bacterium]
MGMAIRMWFHTEQPIVVPSSDGSASTTGLEGFNIGDNVGNPLYSVVNEHLAAVVVLLLLPLLTWVVVRSARVLASRGVPWAAALQARVADAPLNRRIAGIAVAWSAVLHGVLVFTHAFSFYTVLYAAGAAALGWAAWSIVSARRRAAVSIVVLSIAAYWVLGAPPDQLGLFTKLMELFALTLLAIPAADGQRRLRRMAPAGVVCLLVFTSLASWIGAFASAGADGGHHGGEFPGPATLVPYVERLEPTPTEAAFAEEVYWATVAAVAKYQDPSVAEAAGYDVGTIRGSDHHAQNPGLIGDGRILDPEYPESLIYAETPHGPILVGVMFETDGIRDTGPTDGGPIVMWHRHENVCFSLLPPAIAGIESPFGMCPLGSLNIPYTGEMVHAWTLPGVPKEDHWGHIDDEWLDAYISELEQHDH